MCVAMYKSLRLWLLMTDLFLWFGFACGFGLVKVVSENNVVADCIGFRISMEEETDRVLVRGAVRIDVFFSVR